jgi:hypothetical protein
MVRCLEIRNLSSRQDEVLSLTPNDSLFFIVQIVNTLNEQLYEPYQQSCHWLAKFFDEGLQQPRRCPPGCFLAKLELKKPAVSDACSRSHQHSTRSTKEASCIVSSEKHLQASSHRLGNPDMHNFIERSIKYSIRVLLSFVKSSILANPCFWWLLRLNYEHGINKLMYENGIEIRPLPARILEILRSSYQLRARRWPSLNE